MTQAPPYEGPPLEHPPCDDDFAPPNRGLENAVRVLAAQMGNLADSINHLAVASQAVRTPPGASKPPAGAGGPPQPQAPNGGPPSPPSGEKTVQQKRGGLIYFACRDNGWANKAGEIGEQILKRPLGNDARLWADADQIAVLEQFKEWRWIEEKGR